MQIFSEPVKIPDLSLALGYFDGVHRGHKAVINSAVNFARINNTKSAVVTFKDHPCCYFWKVAPKYILTRKMREEKIAALGIDYLFELDFESISGLTAEEYLKDILINYFTPKAVSTGYNHYFGYKKSGNVKYLEQQANKFGYRYLKIKPQKIDDEIISSTAIRNRLFEGKIERANSMLGYKFSISGEVVRGQQIGRTIGFRTANLIYPQELIELPFGVYSVNVIFENSLLKGIANFGMRPTVSGKFALLEVHILDFDRDIYGQNITVEFNKMIRAEQKFPSLEDLKRQISKDIMNI